jgi:polar amino acid transport system substrate-binding protein
MTRLTNREITATTTAAVNKRRFSMRLVKSVLGVTCAAIMILGVTASGALAQQADQPKLIEQIKKRGKINVGMSTFVPWAMRDKQGTWIGFEIDVAKKLATDMGVELELVPTAWDGIVPSLIAGKFDTIIGGLSITPERQKTVDFTIPYSQSGVGVAASKQLASKMKWPDDYNKPDVTFTCKRGIAACADVQRQFPNATLRQFDDTAIGFQEVINGNAHATVASEPAPTFYVLQNPDQLFQPTTAYLSANVEGFALRKGDAEAMDFFNSWIKTNQDNGWLKERHDFWFRTRDWADRVSQ